MVLVSLVDRMDYFYVNYEFTFVYQQFYVVKM